MKISEQILSLEELKKDSIDLLKQLIGIPSFSKMEEGTANCLEEYLKSKGVVTGRSLNNVWARNLYYEDVKPTILLCSHHDTVRPAGGYSRDPLVPSEKDGKLFGLGSNDAGGALVALVAAFLHFYQERDLGYNVIIAAVAEEEISGRNGIECLLPLLGKIDAAIVGEPTQMKMAIAEKGLVVLDCVCYGRAGHAARAEGENAIYNAVQDIQWFRSYQFPRVSELLGPVKMSVTKIRAGEQHNVVPDRCEFVVDVRTTDVYTNEEILGIIRSSVRSEVTPRSLRLRSSGIHIDHPIVKAGKELGLEHFGSATLSDQALLSVPSLKIGPGDSARSHSADEYIFLEEVREGIETYIELLKKTIL